MYPCHGLRVLDMSRVVAGPIAGRILSDLGADVVKLEPPEGDVTRNWGQVRHGLSGFYTQQNAGKRNVCVDLRAEGAVDVVRSLANHADIVIENFRAGVLDRLGLGYAQLSAANPRVMMLSVSGFGRGGPESHRPAYAPMMHAETGLLHRQAEFDAAWPSDPMLSLADSYSGLHGTIAIFAALRVRDETGAGQHIDMAMFDAITFSDDYTHHAIDNEPVVRLGGDVYMTAAGPVLFAGQLRAVWGSLKHLIDDPAPGEVPISEKARLRKAAVADWAASFDNFDDLAARARQSRSRVRTGPQPVRRGAVAHRRRAWHGGADRRQRRPRPNAWRGADAVPLQQCRVRSTRRGPPSRPAQRSGPAGLGWSRRRIDQRARDVGRIAVRRVRLIRGREQPSLGQQRQAALDVLDRHPEVRRDAGGVERAIQDADDRHEHFVRGPPLKDHGRAAVHDGDAVRQSDHLETLVELGLAHGAALTQPHPSIGTTRPSIT